MLCRECLLGKAPWFRITVRFTRVPPSKDYNNDPDERPSRAGAELLLRVAVVPRYGSPPVVDSLPQLVGDSVGIVCDRVTDR